MNTSCLNNAGHIKFLFSFPCYTSSYSDVTTPHTHRNLVLCLKLDFLLVLYFRNSTGWAMQHLRQKYQATHGSRSDQNRLLANIKSYCGSTLTIHLLLLWHWLIRIIYRIFLLRRLLFFSGPTLEGENQGGGRDLTTFRPRAEASVISEHSHLLINYIRRLFDTIFYRAFLVQMYLSFSANSQTCAPHPPHLLSDILVNRYLVVSESFYWAHWMAERPTFLWNC